VGRIENLIGGNTDQESGSGAREKIKRSKKKTVDFSKAVSKVTTPRNTPATAR
jgi:hypothetical protein